MLQLPYEGIDGGNGTDVYYVAYRCVEVGEVDGFVESHLDGANDFHVGIQHLQHLEA